MASSEVAEAEDITADDELRKRKGKKKAARAYAAEADGVTEAVAGLDGVEPAQGEPTMGSTKKRSMSEATGEDQEMPANTAAGTDEFPPVDPPIIYVGGVKGVSADQIRNHFKQCGELVDVRCPVITCGKITRPVGCAFLTFKKKKDAAEALSLDGSKLCEKTIRVQIKLPDKPKPEKVRAPKRNRKNDRNSMERKAAKKRAIEKAALKVEKSEDAVEDNEDGDAKKSKKAKKKVEKSEDAVEDTDDGEAKKAKKAKRKVEKSEDAVEDNEDGDAKKSKKAKKKVEKSEDAVEDTEE
eukprot:TRINITY_DN30918_c1_g1_i3.p1 TRINITY_DN30918_c1_g1~~TRINITY_DN30918_c1_g1_i3.p1  ORF type:complete len:297 (+),score=86.07 TRINITY_DN30918_c1_g1_i3:96-986(+)